MKFTAYGILFGWLILLANVQAGNYDEELQKISTSFGTSLENANLKNVAIVSIKKLDGTETNLGKFLAEEISANLVNQNKKFGVVDRANLSRIMEEQKLKEDGLVDPTNTKKLKLAGIDAIIFGTVAPFDGSYRVNLKAITTDNAKVIAAVSGSITRTDSLDTMMGISKVQTSSGQSTQIQNSEQQSTAKTKTFDVGKAVFEIKSIDFFKKTGKVRVTYLVTLKKNPSGGVSDNGWQFDANTTWYFRYYLRDKNNPNEGVVTYNHRPDYEVVGEAKDDKDNSYKIQLPPDEATAAVISKDSGLSAQVEYQIATNGVSEIQIPSTVSFWFEYGINTNNTGYLTKYEKTKFSVIDFPIDKIR